MLALRPLQHCPPPTASSQLSCSRHNCIFSSAQKYFQNHDWDPGGRAQHVLSHSLSPSVHQPRPRLLLLHPHLRPQQPQLQVKFLKRGLQLVELKTEASRPRLCERAAEEEGWMVRKSLQLGIAPGFPHWSGVLQLNFVPAIF